MYRDVEILGPRLKFMGFVILLGNTLMITQIHDYDPLYNIYPIQSMTVSTTRAVWVDIMKYLITHVPKVSACTSSKALI
jgi:hypothetical protein